MHHKDKKTKHTVLCHRVSSQIILAVPRLGAEEGVGRTTKKNEHEKPTVPCLCLAPRLPRPWPRTEWGGRRDGRKANKRAEGTTPGPALSEGSVGQEKNKTIQNQKRTNQAAQPNHARDAPNPDIKIPKHLKEPKEKTQIPRRRKHHESPKGKTQIPRRRKATRSNPWGRTQKTGKLSSAAAT